MAGASEELSKKDEQRGEEIRRKTAELLKINLDEPRQEKRIEALRELHKKYSSQISVRSFIYRDSVEVLDELLSIYEQKKKLLDELKVSDESFSVTKIKLENINFRFSERVRALEEKVNFNRELLVAYDNRYIKDQEITLRHKKHLRNLENLCWENWLRSLDVNKELTNTIIGFENRRALHEISKMYVEYYAFVENLVSKCFDDLKKMKEDGIFEYYEILRNYQLPLDKKMDFKAFLQKKIESKLSDTAVIKSLFGDFATSQRRQLDESIEQIQNQYVRDQQDMMSVINYYKNFLIQKQVLFTNESQQLVLYFKKRYMEKIDLLCSRFQLHNSEMTIINKRIEPKDLNLLKKLVEEEFQTHLNNLKINYSKKFIPLLDNFWHLEQTFSKKYALDEETLMNKFMELKDLKNINLSHLVDEFKAEKERIRSFFDGKIEIMTDVGRSEVAEFNRILEELKEECDVVCCEVINLNARFWTKSNAEFNCIIRKILIELRHQYAPYISSWMEDSKCWMHDYLVNNLNQELLKATGDALEGFSPESELYQKASKALLYFNETSRKIFMRRDNIEREQLISLNTLPTVDMENLMEEYNEKTKGVRVCRDAFFRDYNSFYDSLLK